MSYCADLKELLREKTHASLRAPQKKNRLKSCCADAFCRGWEAFGKSPDSIGDEEKIRKPGHCEDCDGLFLRGAFLASGSMADPVKRYHLEISLADGNSEELLREVLERYEIPFKTVRRKEKEIFYLKDSDVIADFLTLIGAQTKSLELMETKVEKSVKNRINRLNNSDSANLKKTIHSAGRVADAIKFLKKHDRFDPLPEPLKKTAALRQKYPGASLSELCLYSEEHITKSGLNHRLQKIVEEADRLEASLKMKEKNP